MDGFVEIKEEVVDIDDEIFEKIQALQKALIYLQIPSEDLQVLKKKLLILAINLQESPSVVDNPHIFVDTA